MKSGWIKAHCHFLDESEYAKGSDYWWFMKWLTSYKKEGDNAHDDAPDSMTILAEFIDDIRAQKVINRKTVDSRPVK